MKLIQSKILIFVFFISSFGFTEELFLDQVRPPWGYVFRNWKGPPLDVIVYIPPKAIKTTPILIVIPGTSRDTQQSHASWISLAKNKTFIVLTLGIRKQYFPDEYSYNSGRVVSRKGDLIDESEWLFSAIEPLFNDFKDRYGLLSNKFFLYGHSSGGGFVHRYLLFKPSAPIAKAVAVNILFVTVPDKEIQYPFGLKNTPITNKDFGIWFDKKLAIILQKEDLNLKEHPLSGGTMANIQGASYLERGRLLFNAAKESAQKQKKQLNWSLITIPEGKDNFQAVSRACKYFFEE